MSARLSSTLPDDVFYRIRLVPNLSVSRQTLHSRCQRAWPEGRTRTCVSSLRSDGGARRDRTDDLMLAKHALYQLSYGPIGALRRAVGDLSQPFAGLVGPGRLELPTLRLSGVRSNHLSYGPTGRRRSDVSTPWARDRAARPGWPSRREEWKEKRRRRTFRTCRCFRRSNRS